MTQKRLKNKSVEAAVDKIIREYLYWGKRYKKGIRTIEECYQRMEIGIRENLAKIFRDNNWKLCLSRANFPHFCREFDSYLKDDTSNNPDHIPWLYYDTEEKCEALHSDQLLFFDLMKKLHLAPDCFEPLPEDIPGFDIDQIHQYAFEGIYSTEFNCVDDDGLLEDENPIGKTFRLKNELGLNAVVTIEKEDNKNCETGSRTPVEFIAIGYIEGYTATDRTCNPEIRIWIGKDRKTPWRLIFWQNAHDLNARSAYPLWQKYFQWCDAKKEKCYSILRSAFEEYPGMMDL